MSTACPRTRLWLYKTARSWCHASCRAVSTTSAINRGLRATKEAEGGTSRRNPGTERFDARGWQATPSRDTGTTETVKRYRGRGSIATQDPASQDSGDDIGEDSVVSGVRRQGRNRNMKFESRTEGGRNIVMHMARKGPEMSAREAAAYFHQMYDKSGLRPPRSDAEVRVIPDRMKRRSDSSADKSYPSMKDKHSSAAQQAADQETQEVNAIMSTVKNFLSGIRDREASSDSRSLPRVGKGASELRQALRTINHMWSTETWTANSIDRGLRSVCPPDLWSWRKPDGSSTQLWFDRQRRLLQLIWKGCVVDSDDGARDMKQGQEATTANSTPKKDVKARVSTQQKSREPRAPDRDQRAPREPASRDSDRRRSPRMVEPDESEDEMPLSVTYTTAASVFLYGFNTILAALKAKRRRLYQLYLNDRLAHREGSNPKTSIEELAKAAGVPIQSGANVKLLDKMAERRPHNGVVLEASKLPTPPVLGLGRPDLRSSIIPLTLDRQNAEDIVVNGAPEAIPTATNTWRQPFVVMLDGITDPGNVGSVLRTCHFYGVDAVAIATNTCANLNSGILAKASSGACEAVRIFALPKPSGFVYESAKAGWRIYAAVAPEAPALSAVNRSANKAGKYLTTSTLASLAPLAKHPCILMLGAEGEGLRDNLKNKADYFVSIESAPRHSDFLDVGVDSVNVSVAASVLLESFLRKPDGVKNLVVESDLGF